MSDTELETGATPNTGPMRGGRAVPIAAPTTRRLELVGNGALLLPLPVISLRTEQIESVQIEDVHVPYELKQWNEQVVLRSIAGGWPKGHLIVVTVMADVVLEKTTK
jgi:hypothetical protein